MSPIQMTAAICEALDAERARNPGADLLRAREVVIQTAERLAWSGLSMGGVEMMPLHGDRYEVSDG